MIRVADIQAAVARHYKLPRRIMRDRSQCHCCSHPRQMAMYLARELTPHSLPNIGKMFGGRDHTTVMHAIRCVESRIAVDDELAQRVEAVRAELVG